MGSNHETDSDADLSPRVPLPGSLVADLEFVPPQSLVPEGDLPPEGVRDGTSDMVPVGSDDPKLTHLDPILEVNPEPEVTVPIDQGNIIANVQIHFTPRYDLDDIELNVDI